MLIDCSFLRIFVGLLPLAFCLNGYVGSAAEDDFIVQVWDTDSGLPHSTVTSIAQTPDGYLWVGTSHGGLARFDGVRFVNFHPDDIPELRSMEIQKLRVDSQGTLWVGTAEGALVSYRDGRFHLERHRMQMPQSFLNEVISSSSNSIELSSVYGWLFRGTLTGETYHWNTLSPPNDQSVLSMCADFHGTIWYRTLDNGLGQIRTNQFVRLANPPGLRSPRINALLTDSAGQLWVGTEKEIARWDGQRFVDMTPTNGEPDMAVRQMTACQDGSLWVRTGNELRKCQGRQWIARADVLDGMLRSSARDLKTFADSWGGLWLAKFGEGLWHMDAGGKVSLVRTSQGLPSGMVECWFEDREGNIWLGLTDGGLARVRVLPFHTVWPTGGQTFSAPSSICEDQHGAMWFGTFGTLLLRWQDGEFASFTPPVEQTVGQNLSVCPDDLGRLWVGSVLNGVVTLENEKFNRPFPANSIGSVARVIYKDRSGRIWIGSEFGLFCWEHEKLRRFTEADGFTPAYANVLAITEDAAGSLWFGTAVGELRRYKDGKFTTYRPNDSPLNPQWMVDPLQEHNHSTLYGSERFWALLADVDGVIWIGTLGGGLLRFQDGEFTRYTLHEGLPDENVCQILADGRGQLWLGTRGGIMRANIASLNQFARDKTNSVSFVNYGKLDGLPAVECSDGIQPGCWRARDGHLWFATVKGAVWIDPTDLRFNVSSAPVIIEDIFVDGVRMAEGKQVSKNALPALARMQIPVIPHFLDFKFTALNLSSPDKVRFRWQMVGLEKGWTPESDLRSVSYCFVPPGDYEFRVQACNSDGIWSKTAASFKFTVLPYFWQTWWFRICSGLFLAAILSIIYVLRIAQLRNFEHLRLRIARDLHDELGANLGSISLLAQVMEQQPSRADATQVRGIAVESIEKLRDIVWFIEPKYDRLGDLMRRLDETARNMLHHVAYQFDQRGDLRSAKLSLAFRRNVPPLFKEALHNILKHAHATSVQITVRHWENKFQIRITDNGVGFDEAATQHGDGLKNMRRRASEIGGRIEIASHCGRGTTLILTAPIT